MIRYSGQPLPSGPRIAVFANDAIGNFVVATPLLQLLRQERSPSRLDFFGGRRTHELQAASNLFDYSFEPLGAPSSEIAEMLNLSGKYDLFVNLESTPFAKSLVGLLAGDRGFVVGPCMGPGGRGELPYSDDVRGELWRDKEWIAEDLMERYPFLRSGFIAEIFARLCYLEGSLPGYRVPRAEPQLDVPDVLIATAASLPEKLWPIEKWRRVVEKLRQSGLSVGLLGAPPKAQAEHWKGASEEEDLIGDGLATDLRGKMTLPEVVGALKEAKAVLTLDNGILHLAVAAGTSTVGLYRHGIHRLWAPPSDRLTVLTPSESNEVAEIAEEAVLDALGRQFGAPV